MARNLIRVTGLMLAFAMPFLSGITGNAAQASDPLSATDRARAISIARQVGLVRTESATIAGAPTKSVVTSVVPIGQTSQGAEASSAGEPRRAEVSRFDYATGETIRTVVDLGSGGVLATRSDKNFPTPLAPEELEDAKSLLMSTIPDVKSIVDEAATSDVTFQHLVSVAPSTQSKSYGHRVVVIWLTKPKQTRRYRVDLTTRVVE